MGAGIGWSSQATDKVYRKQKEMYSALTDRKFDFTTMQ